MPKSKRPPISYTPQFGGGIFRPREVVEDELAATEAAAVSTPTLDEAVEVPVEPDRTEEEQSPPPAARPATERSNERSIVRTNERTKIRHTFDIFQDQLQSLAEIQAARFKEAGRKPKMGDLVQEALDAYIEQINERTNERRKRRSNAG